MQVLGKTERYAYFALCCNKKNKNGGKALPPLRFFAQEGWYHCVVEKYVPKKLTGRYMKERVEMTWKRFDDFKFSLLHIFIVNETSVFNCTCEVGAKKLACVHYLAVSHLTRFRIISKEFRSRDLSGNTGGRPKKSVGHYLFENRIGRNEESLIYQITKWLLQNRFQ